MGCLLGLFCNQGTGTKRLGQRERERRREERKRERGGGEEEEERESVLLSCSNKQLPRYTKDDEASGLVASVLSELLSLVHHSVNTKQ
jgi:hypothetical protein